MKIFTWNMDYWKRDDRQRRAAEDYLFYKIDPDIALLQEVCPTEAWSKEYNVLYHPVDLKDRWGTAIVSKRKIIREYYLDKGYYGSNGTVVAEVEIDDVRSIILISLYGRIDRRGYATTTMHYLLSDLTKFFVDKKKTIILGGDFNVSKQIDDRFNNQYPSHRLVFERIENFDMFDCTYSSFGGHVQTHNHSKSDFPWKNDYIFVDSRIRNDITGCEVLNDEEMNDLSDHYPVVINLNIPTN